MQEVPPEVLQLSFEPPHPSQQIVLLGGLMGDVVDEVNFFHCGFRIADCGMSL